MVSARAKCPTGSSCMDRFFSASVSCFPPCHTQSTCYLIYYKIMNKFLFSLLLFFYYILYVFLFICYYICFVSIVLCTFFQFLHSFINLSFLLNYSFLFFILHKCPGLHITFMACWPCSKLSSHSFTNFILLSL